MAKAAEAFVIEYLNRQGFAIAQSLKKGTREWDVLAISTSTGSIRARHYEVQVSFDPVGFLSARNARKRLRNDINRDMAAWFTKKYERPEIRKIRSHFFNGDWEFWFVHGVIKESQELDWLRQRGVRLLTFNEILTNLCTSHPKRLPFTGEGKDIVEIVRSIFPTTE